jgi:hypothetical protein
MTIMLPTRFLRRTFGVVALAVLGAACGDPTSAVPPIAAPPPITISPIERVPSGQPVTLYVSNQSFAEPTVPITIVIDGNQVVSDSFKVESQHNWKLFNLSLATGTHELVAAAPNGTTLTMTITVTDAPRWLVVNYWYNPDDTSNNTRFLELTDSDKPVLFA